MDDFYNDVTRLHSDIEALRNELRAQGLLTAVLDQRLKALEIDVEKLSDHADTHYVSLARYLPLEKVLYGMIGLILVTFVGAIAALIWKVP
jgi:hypothetical protein